MTKKPLLILCFVSIFVCACNRNTNTVPTEASPEVLTSLNQALLKPTDIQTETFFWSNITWRTDMGEQISEEYGHFSRMFDGKTRNSEFIYFGQLLGCTDSSKTFLESIKLEKSDFDQEIQLGLREFNERGLTFCGYNNKNINNQTRILLVCEIHAQYENVYSRFEFRMSSSSLNLTDSENFINLALDKINNNIEKLDYDVCSQ